ncbi:MAG TPA: hypothetical protein DEH25_16215 [Chloroflexi bacterium]|nr:hypothetical protein [Chloroflexota bacterium]
MNVRKSDPAFHPNGDQKVISLHPAIFAVLRSSPAGESHVLCLHNVADQNVDIEFNLNSVMGEVDYKINDLLNNQTRSNLGETKSLTIQPYQVLWLKLE